MTSVIPDMKEPKGRAGMVETTYEGRMVEVFLDDLLQRGELVDGHHA